MADDLHLEYEEWTPTQLKEIGNIYVLYTYNITIMFIFTHNDTCI